MRGSSVNFKKITSALHSVGHSSREIPPTYLLPEEHSLGTHVVIDDAGSVAKTLAHKMSLASRQAKASKDFSALWEGVINLPDPTEQLNASQQKLIVKRWCVEYEKLTGHKVLRADVHLDEGHIDSAGAVQFNAHAHVMCDRTDDRGKVIKLSPKQLREIQTMTAEITNLQRGVDARKTGRTHVSHQDYRSIAEKVKGKLDKEKSKISAVESLLDASNARAKTTTAKLKAAKLEADKVPTLESQISQQAAEIVQLNEQYRIARQELKDSGTAKQSDYQSLKKQHDAALIEISQLKKGMEKMTNENQELRAANERLEASARRTLKTLERDFNADVSAGDKLRGSELNDFCNAVEDQVFEKQMAERTQTPKEAFLEAYTGVDVVEVHRIDGARLDAAEGRLGLFTWPNRATGGRNEALCEVPDHKVMPVVGSVFDSRAVPGRGRGRGD